VVLGLEHLGELPLILRNTRVVDVVRGVRDTGFQV